MANLRNTIGAAACCLLAFLQVAHAIVAFRFDTSRELSYIPYYPTFEVYSNVSSFTCLNLDEVFSNNDTVTNDSITDRTSSFFTLNDVLYTRSELLNGGNSSGENWMPSLSYDKWAIAQGQAPRFRTNSTDPPALGDSSVNGAMQIYVFEQEDCDGSQGNPYRLYTCENEVASASEGPFAAKSVALAPNDMTGPGCLWGSRRVGKEGEEESGAAPSAGLREGGWMVWGVAVLAMGMAAAMS